MGSAGLLGALALLVATEPASGPAPLPRAPAAPEQCLETLRAARFKLTQWSLRPTALQSGVVCEAPEGVAIKRGGSGQLPERGRAVVMPQ